MTPLASPVTLSWQWLSYLFQEPGLSFPHTVRTDEFALGYHVVLDTRPVVAVR